MNKRFRTCGLNQIYLLPPSLQDWLPEDHLARFIADVMDELDLSAVYADYERKDGRGLSAYHPILMTRLLLYGYCLGVTSSRRIEKATHDDVAFRYLAANQHPDHDTIAEFRHRHLNALAGLFVQALRLCQKAGLVKLGNVSIDGTKILANASTRRSVGYEKLTEREQYWKDTVERLLAEAERTDEAEDQQWGKGKPAEPLPPELAKAQSRLERLRQAKAELEREAKQELEAATQAYQPRKRGRPRKQDSAAHPPQDPQQRHKARSRARRAKKNAEEPKRQYNFVDPDSRVMKDNARKCFVQAYNAQIAVDAERQVIVAAELTQEVNDRQQLVPMIKAVKEAAGSSPAAATADTGYWDGESLKDPALEKIQVLVPPDSKSPDRDSPAPAKAPQSEAAKQMREVLASEAGAALYAKRKSTVEPVFGQIKETRGIRRFRLRGFEQTAREWKLICATHNLLKVFRHRFPPKPQQSIRSKAKRAA